MTWAWGWGFQLETDLRQKMRGILEGDKINFNPPYSVLMENTDLKSTDQTKDGDFYICGREMC